MSEKIQLLDSKFKKTGEIKLPAILDSKKISKAAIHQVVKSILANSRQGNASTKTRANVRGGGAKPFKQKGTGRARQGSIRSPLLVGGGVAFGPQPRSFKQKVNKKMNKKAIQSIVSDKFHNNKLIVVDKLESTGKTKDMFKLLSSKKLLPALVVTNDNNENVLRSVRNIKFADALKVSEFSVYDTVKYENLIIEKLALESILNKVILK